MNGTIRSIGDLRAGIPEGHNLSGANIVINLPMNDTEYVCISSVLDTDDVTSPPAFLYIAGEYDHSTMCTYKCMYAHTYV